MDDRERLHLEVAQEAVGRAMREICRLQSEMVAVLEAVQGAMRRGGSGVAKVSDAPAPACPPVDAPAGLPAQAAVRPVTGDARSAKAAARRDAVVAAVRTGLSADKVAEYLDAPFSTVKNDIRVMGGVEKIRAGGPINVNPVRRGWNPSAKVQARRDRIAELITAGKSVAEAAEVLGLSVAMVNTDVHVMGGVAAMRAVKKPMVPGRAAQAPVTKPEVVAKELPQPIARPAPAPRATSTPAATPCAVSTPAASAAAKRDPDGWTDARDLMLLEGLARGKGAQVVAAELKVGLSLAVKRFKQLVPNPTLEAQAAKLAELRSTCSIKGGSR